MLGSARAWWRAQSLWLVLPAVVAVAALVQASGPIVDPDAYWHVLMGRDIWTEHRFGGDPDWVFGPGRDWVTTQWLSEILMAALHQVWGWSGLTALRVVSAVVVLVLLGVATLRGPGGTRPRAIVLALAIIGVLPGVQERPAAVALVLTVIVGLWCRRALTGSGVPPLWAVAAMTVLWVNLHGTWVLMPVAWTAVAAVLFVTERRWSRPVAARAVAALACGIVSPAGMYAYQAPFTVRAAAGPFIEEWAPSAIDSGPVVALLVLASALAVTAATGADRPPLAPALWVTGWALFAALAHRNVPVSMALVAPVAADLLARQWPEPARPATWFARLVTGALAVVTVAGVGVRLATTGGLPPEVPVRALQAIAAEPGPRRVLNDYGLAGQVLALTRPGVAVAIDGRTDRYGAAILRRHQALTGGLPGWDTQVAALSPTDALLGEDRPLVDHLRRHGWSQVSTEHGVVHLVAPSGSPGRHGGQNSAQPQ